MDQRRQEGDSSEQVAEIERMIADVAKRLLEIKGHIDTDTEYASQLFDRWRTSTRDKIRDLLGEDEATKFADVSDFVGWGMYAANLHAEVDAKAAYLRALLDTLKRDPSSVLRTSRPAKAPVKANPSHSPHATEAKSSGRKKVFIIHGHDEMNRQRLARLLHKEFNVEAVILLEEAGEGRFNMEKFEAIASTCDFAIALLTPDDLIEVTDVDGRTKRYTQARPNAIYELGWFHSKLGRKGACILIKGDLRLHSDLDGIAVIRFKDDVGEKSLEIGRELKAGGIV